MREPIRVCLLGGRGAGKTCFLAGLAVATEPNRSTPLTLDAVGSSRQRLDEWAAQLRGGAYPPGTTATDTLELTLTLDRTLITLSMLDYPGEDLVTALRQMDATQAPELCAQLARADVLLLLFGPDTDLRPAPTDRAHAERLLHRHDTLLQAVVQTSRARAPLVAVVVTKADQEPELLHASAARSFFRRYLPQLDAKLRHHAERVGYHAVSAVGRAGVGAGRPPSVLAPTGYIELLRWIIAQRQAARWAPFWRGAAVVATPLLLLALVLGVNWYRAYEQQRQAEVAQAEALADRLATLTATIEAAASVAQLADAERTVAHLAASVPDEQRATLEKLAQRAHQQLRLARFTSAQLAHTERRPDWREVAQRFLADYTPAGRDRTQVEQWLQADREAAHLAERARIRRMEVNSPDELLTFAAAVRAYVKDWQPNPDETRKLLRATALAEQFARPHEYELTVVRSGDFVAPHFHRVVVQVGTNVWTFTGPDAVKTATWERTTFRTSWDVRQPIVVRWQYADTFGAGEVANRQSDGVAGLVQVSQRFELVPNSVKRSYCTGTPYVEFRCPDLTADDRVLIADYILPGTAW